MDFNKLLDTSDREKVNEMVRAGLLVEEWQRNLKLEDWTIRIGIVDAADINTNGDEERLGQNLLPDLEDVCEIQIVNRAERLKINPDAPVKRDLRSMVVHELIHAVLRDWKTDGDVEERLMERAVNKLTASFCAMDDLIKKLEMERDAV